MNSAALALLVLVAAAPVWAAPLAQAAAPGAATEAEVQAVVTLIGTIAQLGPSGAIGLGALLLSRWKPTLRIELDDRNSDALDRMSRAVEDGIRHHNRPQ